jgi:hypothetical protein
MNVCSLLSTPPSLLPPSYTQRQYISSLVKILPDEITDTLRVLQDKNPGEPFEDVCRVLEVSFDGARRDDH